MTVSRSPKKSGVWIAKSLWFFRSTPALKGGQVRWDSEIAGSLGSDTPREGEGNGQADEMCRKGRQRVGEVDGR